MQLQAKGLPATPEGRRTRKDPPLQREHGPAHTLISDFQPPELGENRFLLFYATQWVVLGYGRCRKHRPIFSPHYGGCKYQTRWESGGLRGWGEQLHGHCSRRPLGHMLDPQCVFLKCQANLPDASQRQSRPSATSELLFSAVPEKVGDAAPPSVCTGLSLLASSSPRQLLAHTVGSCEAWPQEGTDLY